MAHLSHKIALDPTAAQAEYFRRACGTARFVWNWALAEWNRRYEAGEKPTAMGIKKAWNAVKYQQYPWLEGIHRDAHAQPFAALGEAFRCFFRKESGHPRFKKKGRCRDAFAVANDKFSLDGFRVRLPLIGWVRMREELRFAGKILSGTVSREADRWFVSIAVEVPDVARKRTGDGIIGVDVGIKHAAVLSTGEKIEGPRPLCRNLRRLRLRQRQLSRRVKGSNNRRRLAMRVAKLHARIANVRRDFWHKLSTRLCRENQAVGAESLNVAGMLRNRSLSRAVVDSGFGMLGLMLTYKASLYGTRLVKADPFYPSSKTCAACGRVNESLTLSDREWACPCGSHHDRDVNAAKNLAALALPAACGEVTPVRDERPPKGARGRNTNRGPVNPKVTVPQP